MALPMSSLLKIVLPAVLLPVTVYFGILSLLILVPSFQIHAFYLHRVTLTWFRDLNVPENFGFLHNQVTPFYIETVDGFQLHAWHILPLGVYRRHLSALLEQPSSVTADPISRLSFKLLREDTEARLVIYLHGTSGTLASGWRPDSYRALSHGNPDKIHVLAFDYRGYGLSGGSPSEEGLLRDAIAVAKWAMEIADIPPSRIVLFGQSLGTAVAISLSRHYALETNPVHFAGMLLVAAFSDVATLTSTYRIGGIIPVLSPIARIPPLLAFFQGHLSSTWLSKDRIGEFVRACEGGVGKYHITLIHSEDDADIPRVHSDVVTWHAVRASKYPGITFEDLEKDKQTRRTDLGNGGWNVEWRTNRGVIREEIVKYGLHDKVMSYPVIGLAVLRSFKASLPDLVI